MADNGDPLQLLHKKFTVCKAISVDWQLDPAVIEISRVSENVTAGVYPTNMVNNTLGVRASAKRRARFELQTVADAYFSASV